MLEQKLREAIQNNNWDTAQKIEALLKGRQDRIIQARKWQLEESTMEANIEKYLAETEKLKKESQRSWVPTWGAIIGMMIAFGTFIKSFFDK